MGDQHEEGHTTPAMNEPKDVIQLSKSDAIPQKNHREAV